MEIRRYLIANLTAGVNHYCLEFQGFDFDLNPRIIIRQKLEPQYRTRMAYQLQITPSVGKRWTYALEKPLAKIGRTPHCDVVIKDPLVSREHCLLQLKSEGLFLEDLNSANGTLVNEQRITRVLLHPGDKIRLGLSEIVLEQIPEKKRSLPAPPVQPPSPGLSRSDRGEAEPPRAAEPEKPKKTLPEKSPGPEAENQTGTSGTLHLLWFPPIRNHPLYWSSIPDAPRIEGQLEPLVASGVVIRQATDPGSVRRPWRTRFPIVSCSAIRSRRPWKLIRSCAPFTKYAHCFVTPRENLGPRPRP